MRSLLTSKRYFFLFLVFLFISLSINVWGQLAGDYRSSLATGNWDTPGTWQRYNGTSWVTATDYPGQNSSTCNVTIVNSTTVTMLSTTTVRINDLTIKPTGVLIVNGKLTVNGNFTEEFTGNYGARFSLGSGGLTIVNGNATIENKADISIDSHFIVIGTLSGGSQTSVSLGTNADVYVFGNEYINTIVICDNYPSTGCTGGTEAALANHLSTLPPEIQNIILSDVSYSCTTTTSTWVTPPSSNGNVCEGGTITLIANASSAVSYRWTGPNGYSVTTANTSLTIPNATLAMSGTYTCTAITSGFCLLTSSSPAVYVFSNTINAPSTTSFCETTGSSNVMIIGSDMGSGTTYQWQVCTNPNNQDAGCYTDISGATSKDYNPGAITNSNRYRRKLSGSCNSTSNIVGFDITPPITSNTISPQAPLNNCGPITEYYINGSYPSGGYNNNFTFQWQSSTNGVNFSNIATATSQGYAPNTISSPIYFRRIAMSGNCSAISNVLFYNTKSATISGTLTVSAGSTTQLSGSPSGGTWSSGTPSVATVNSSSGLVSGFSAGSSIITYTTAGGCSGTATVIVTGLTKPTITSATTASSTYGTASSYQITASNSPTSYNATGLPIGMSINTSTGLITVAAITAAGTYSIPVSATNASGTGSATLNFTVDKANQTITWANPANITYGTLLSATQLNATVAGVSGGSAAGGLTYTPASGTLLNAGIRTLQVAAAATTNYNAATKTVTLVVDKANQTITVTTPSPASATYNTSFTVAATASSGLSVAYTSSSPLTNTGSSYTMNSGTGTGVVKYNQAGDANYNAALEVTANVNAAKATATVTLGNLAPTYTGSPISATATTTPSGLIVDFTYNGSSTAPTNSGTYAVVGTINDSNYQGSASGSMIIGKSNSTITVTGSTAFTYTGSAQGSTTSTISGSTGAVAYSYSGTGSTSYTASATPPTNGGTYQVIASVAADVNYNGASSVAFGFTINKANALIAVTPYNVTYDSNPHTSTGTATGVETPTPSDLSSLLTLSGTTHTAAGTYNNDSWSFAGNANYIQTSGTVNNTIGKANSTILVTGSSTFTYTGLAQGPASVDHTGSTGAITYSYIGTSIGGVIYGPSATAPTLAGSYNVIASLADDDNFNGATSSSYAFTINAKSLTVTANDRSKVYGAALPALTVSYSGFVNGETSPSTLPIISTAATASSLVGNYPITASGAYDPNYTIDYVDGTLTVTQATVVPAITANDKCFDGNTTATLSSQTLTGVLFSDVVSLIVGGASFNDANTGNNKVVTANTLSLGGGSASNYVLYSNSATTTANINTLPIPVITGDNSPCNKTTGEVYGTEAGMSNYNWSISSGGTITPGVEPNSITVSWNTDGDQWVSVIYNNGNGCLGSATLTITVHPLPNPGAFITE